MGQTFLPGQISERGEATTVGQDDPVPCTRWEGLRPGTLWRARGREAAGPHVATSDASRLKRPSGAAGQLQVGLHPSRTERCPEGLGSGAHSHLQGGVGSVPPPTP